VNSREERNRREGKDVKGWRRKGRREGGEGEGSGRGREGRERGRESSTWIFVKGPEFLVMPLGLPPPPFARLIPFNTPKVKMTPSPQQKSWIYAYACLKYTVTQKLN